MFPPEIGIYTDISLEDGMQALLTVQALMAMIPMAVIFIKFILSFPQIQRILIILEYLTQQIISITVHLRDRC